MANNNEEFPRISVLIDIFSDRTVAHASFFVTSIFGLLTLLALSQGLKAIYQKIILNIFFFSYSGYYTLLRFNYYADISQKLTGLLKPDSIQISKEDSLLDSENSRGNLQNWLLFPKKIMKKSSKYMKILILI
jgi:hypothetical protein